MNPDVIIWAETMIHFSAALFFLIVAFVFLLCAITDWFKKN